MRLLLIFGICFCLPFHLNGARILGLFASPSQSHFNAIQNVMTALAKSYHNVTTFSSFRFGFEEKTDNFEEINLPSFDFWSHVQNELGVKNMFEAGQSSSSSLRKALRNAGAELSDFFLQQPKLKEKLSFTQEFQYDLIIIDLFYTEALLMVGEVFNTPVVTIASSNFENYLTALVDYLVPSACSPIDFETYTQGTSFFGRVSNFFDCTERRSQRQKDLIVQENVARKHLSASERPLPSLSQVQGRVSVSFLNNYPPLLRSRPTLSNLIPVGGVHIKQTQAIQWNIKRFLDDARDGAIYFSFGTVLKCSDLDKEKLSAIVAAIGKLKENVLWHCDLKNIENPPKNLLLQSIVSSSDVLAHPHVKYFITSGGMLGLQEAIFRNVPILGTPIFRDQKLNIQIIENLGIGMKLEFSNLTESSLTWSLDKLRTDKSILIKIREVSLKYRDRPIGAVQTSLFWIDHVLRHKDLSHLRTTETDISSYQLYLIDVVVVLILSMLGVLIGGYLFYKMSTTVYAKREELKLLSKLR